MAGIVDSTVYGSSGRSFKSIFEDQDEIRRLNRYREAWQFYLGTHKSFIRESGDPIVVFNYVRAIVNKHTNFMFRKGFDIVVADDERSADDKGKGKKKDERFFVKKFLDETWKKNSKRLWCFEAGQMGGVTGDLFVRVSLEDSDPLYPKGYPRADIYPSHLVFPIYGGPEGRDLKTLFECTIFFPAYRENDDGELEEIWLAERWTKDAVQHYEAGELKKTVKNPLGEIPIVHIRNYPIAGAEYGASDIVDIIPLNKEYNEKATDVSDVVFYHGSPITYLIGAKVDQLQRGPDRVWGLPDGAQIGNLELSGDLAAAHKFMETIKTGMLELAGLPEHAFGKIAPVGDVSGVALMVQYLPLVEKRDIKVQTYGEGIERINRLMLRIQEHNDTGFKKKLTALTNPYLNEVMFPNPMPRDEEQELKLSEQRITLGLSTRRRELMRQGVGEQDIAEILKEADEELAKADEQLYNPGGPRPRGNLGPTNFEKSKGSSERAAKVAGI